MTVATYQQVHEINQVNPDTIERLARVVCLVYNLPEQSVNMMHPAIFLWKVRRIEANAKKRSIFFKPRLQTDAAKLTLGQFIECQHWLKNDAIQSLDLVAASILKRRGDHAKDAERMRKAKVGDILPKVEAFITSMNALIKSYAGLFDINDDEGEQRAEEVHPFVERYGWIFSAKEVAAYECITLDKAFNLPVMQAFNGLSYLKAKQAYDKAQSKRS